MQVEDALALWRREDGDAVARVRGCRSKTTPHPGAFARRPSPGKGRGCRSLRSVEDDEADEATDSPWPDLVLIDGGLGQLTAARETLSRARRHRRAADRRSPRGRSAMPGARPSSFPAASRSSSSRAIRCSISCSACATRRIASRSARIGRSARRTSARPACRRSPASARRASARCCTTSAPSRRSSAPRSPTSSTCPGSTPKPPARSMISFTNPTPRR